MNICYYNSQIKEELDGACFYINKAILYKKSHPDWANLYVKMSDAEVDHAVSLLKIFEDEYKIETSKLNPVPPIYAESRTTLVTMYTEFVTKVKILKDQYNSL